MDMSSRPGFMKSLEAKIQEKGDRNERICSGNE